MILKRCTQWLVMVVAVLAINGCSTSIDDYQGKTPDFDLFEYFDGEVLAWGMLQDRSGKQLRRFEVSIVGRVDGNVLTLEENFIFNDGEEQQRIWVISRIDDGQYIGRAEDVIGEARGRVAGNALNWRYVLRVPVDDTTYDISFDDWMFRQDKQRVFNIAEMSKWGFTVGKVVLFFEKQ